jgi:hypothetical protein
VCAMRQTAAGSRSTPSERPGQELGMRVVRIRGLPGLEQKRRPDERHGGLGEVRCGRKAHGRSRCLLVLAIGVATVAGCGV